MMNINPYLHFSGNCATAFRFYQQCLGGDLGMMTWGESPNCEHIDEKWHDKITHAQLTTEMVNCLQAECGVSNDGAKP